MRIPISQGDIEKLFMMPVEGVFSTHGRGAVASGRVERDVLKKDQEVVVVGETTMPIKTEVTDIESFKKSCEESRAGGNAGLLLRGFKREDIQRGIFFMVPGSVNVYTDALILLYVVTEEGGGRKSRFGANYRPQMYLRRADEAASLSWPEESKNPNEMVMPGDNVEMVIKMHHPTVMGTGSGFNIRQGRRTVATGLITRVLK